MAVMPAMQLGPNHKYCPDCATVLDVRAPVCSRCGAPQAGAVGTGKPKSKLAAALLAFFLGGMGVHRFYLGQWGWGLLMFGTFWTFIPSLVALVDFIRYLVMSEDEFQRRYGDLGGGTVAAIVAGVGCPLVVVTVDILAAIAIPSFVLSGLRTRDAGIRLQLETLANAQDRQRSQEGNYLLPPSADVPAEGAYGRGMEWSAEELAWAEALGWRVPGGKTDARFSMAMSPLAGHATSYCAEFDLDGDGRHAAYVLFRPRLDAGGEPEDPPPAPCSEGVVLGGDHPSLEYMNGASPMAEAVRVSPLDVW